MNKLHDDILLEMERIISEETGYNHLKYYINLSENKYIDNFLELGKQIKNINNISYLRYCPAKETYCLLVSVKGNKKYNYYFNKFNEFMKQYGIYGSKYPDEPFEDLILNCNDPYFTIFAKPLT